MVGSRGDEVVDDRHLGFRVPKVLELQTKGWDSSSQVKPEIGLLGVCSLSDTNGMHTGAPSAGPFIAIHRALDMEARLAALCQQRREVTRRALLPQPKKSGNQQCNPDGETRDLLIVYRTRAKLRVS